VRSPTRARSERGIGAPDCFVNPPVSPASWSSYGWSREDLSRQVCPPEEANTSKVEVLFGREPLELHHHLLLHHLGVAEVDGRNLRASIILSSDALP
jgi:hypothetical protein